MRRTTIAMLGILVGLVGRYALSEELRGREPRVDVGDQTQLFVDDYIVEELRGAQRELGQVVKANNGQPIFTEGWLYGTVLYDDARFKLWYRKPGSGGFGYAESADGLSFAPQADVTGINFAGDFTLAVERDAHATEPEQRFIAGYDAPGMAAGLARSADGVHWTPLNDGNPVTGRAADTYNQVLWDPVAKTYRLFTRTDFGSAGGSTELRGSRSMTNPDIAANPTDWTLARSWKFDRDGADEGRRRQIYAATCWIHHGIYFALLSVYEFVGDFSEGQTTDHQRRHERDVMNFYLATSRDCVGWDLQWVYAGQPLVPRGPDGAFDKDILLPASTIVTHDDRHWLYYAGANERHGSESVRFDRRHALGLATMRLDGFVAISAGDETGIVTTRPFKLQDAAISVNIDASQGWATTEVLDESGEPLADYSAENVMELSKSDRLRWRPRWKGRADLAALTGQTIRLRFSLRNAKLYSFQIQSPSAGP